MEANFLSSCIANSNHTLVLFPAKAFTRSRRITTLKNKLAVSSMQESDSQDYEGRLVDESMIILRMRIKEAKIIKENSSHRTEATSNWMEWEKQYYGKHYHEDVCEGIGWLQIYLMNTRPSLALGVLALVAFSVPMSSSMIVFNVLRWLYHCVFVY